MRPGEFRPVVCKPSPLSNVRHISYLVAMEAWLFILLFLIACALAFPLAIGICVVLGFIFMTWWRLTTPCPKCSARRLRFVNGIKVCEGPSMFYACEACSTRWYRVRGDPGLHEATDPAYEHFYTREKPEPVSSSGTP